ncbi:MAG: flagellar hook-length control protein FliK [Burkholderiaceae bacterium]|nr:flagellar hook-length control protein FliK [Burkholderiaceae bacterium]
MSLLMVVKPLLDAAGNVASNVAKGQGGDAGNSFQTLLKGQMTSRQPEKQVVSQASDSKKASTQTDPRNTSNENKPASEQAMQGEPVKEGKPAEVVISGKEGEKTTTAMTEDAAVLAQIMAAAAGAQIVPVEPAPANEAPELSAEIPDMLAAGADESGKHLLAATAGRVTGKDVPEEVADEPVAYEKLGVDAEKELKAADGKAPLEAVAPKTVANAAPAATASTAVPAQAVEPASTQPVQPQPFAAVQAQPVQHTQASPAPLADPAASRIVQQLGTPEWNQAIGQRVLWMVGQEQQSASLMLNPPELGPVRVVVSVSSNHASANFFSANPDVRHALEGSLPRLREMMEGAGIQLGQAQVGAENQGNQQSGQTASAFGGGVAGLSGESGDAGSMMPVTGASAPRVTATRGLVDTFA